MEFSEAIASGLADRPDDQIAQETQQRNEFLERFPRSDWSEMSLERYALGAGTFKQGYSYWLEWGTAALGSIAGGSARKHVIFRRNDGQWFFPREFASVDAAWDALRAGFVQLLDYAERDEWSEIEQIDVLRGSRTVRMKTLYLYFPEQVLPIYSHAHLKHFAEKLDIDATGDVVDVNRRLLTRLREESTLGDRSTQDLARLLYGWERPPGPQKSTYWKIAPGEQAKFWDECLAGGYMCVGWDEIGDLSLFESEEEFHEAFTAVYPNSYRGNKSTQRRKANELWRLTQIEAGDHIIANKGTGEVKGIGVVQEPGYRWDPDRDEYKHTIAVSWDEESGRHLDPPVKQWGTTTILKATAKMVDQVLGKRMVQADPIKQEVQDVDASDLADFQRWQRVLARKGQIIFYGPPGTGKTRVAKNFARWLLRDATGRDATGIAPSLTEVTFHASYAYEEFVEGYRPSQSDGGARLELTPGVMMRIANKAAEHPDRPHVLLIDEINRANVPRVFGELMTVLEKPRRGEAVVLPGSGESFHIPDNVIILGTMNTADRSIRTLDAALRRRFGFIELMPDPGVLEGAVVGDLRLDVFLEQLNKRIVTRAGRERQIGHAYFLDHGAPLESVDDLGDVMRTDIIPMLQEIAFDDYGQLAAYLGPAIIDVESQAVKDIVFDDDLFVAELARAMDARADTSLA